MIVLASSTSAVKQLYSDDLHWTHADSWRVCRITVEPGKCGGKPCIRGMRITVRRVLELLAAYPDRAAVIADYPFLESEGSRSSAVRPPRRARLCPSGSRGNRRIHPCRSTSHRSARSGWRHMHFVQRIVLRIERHCTVDRQREHAHPRQARFAEQSARRLLPVEERFHALVPGLVRGNEGEFSTLGRSLAFLPGRPRLV